MNYPELPGLLAVADDLTVYQFDRLADAEDPRVLLGLIAAGSVTALLYVIWQYGREASNLPRGAAVLLGFLRLLALAGALIFFLKPTKRTDQQTVVDSQVAVLVDISQSMSVSDESYAGKTQLTRTEAIASLFQKSSLLSDLAEQHHLIVKSLGASQQRIAQWNRAEFEAATQSALEEEVETVIQNSSLNWSAELAPTDSRTALGEALAAVLNEQEQSNQAPLAGVVVISDGNNNAGPDPMALAELAAEREIPLYSVGLGTTKPRTNLRVQEMSVPSRAYPEDKTKVRVVVHAEGMRNRNFTVELFAKFGPDAPATRIGSQQVDILTDEQSESVEFEIVPSEIGRIQLEARINAPTDDQFAKDNIRTSEIEVIETSTKVLLLTSGATREYRFLRNQLRRDKHTTVDVLLQMSPPGISQDADRVLTAFPSDKSELYEYDCIVAFDPDWTQLDASEVELLADWVSEQAGGLIIIAGPVHTASLVQSAEHAKIRALYPVEFQRRLSLLDDGIYGSAVPWPLAFERAGQEAEFLALADTTSESLAVWDSFPGVYGCYAVKGAKPGAQVYARYSDPDAGISTQRPVYLAEQFYGSGRVFYMGSGEMWRLRAVDPGLMEKFYTQLVRHVSQVRLERGSSRGMLLLTRDSYRVGEEVPLRALLRTASQEPYVAGQVSLRINDPEGKSADVILIADENRPGTFLGQFTVKAQGDYRLEMPAPDAVDEVITRQLQVSLPDREFNQTRRNETLLASLAATTGGRYYPTLQSVVEGVDEVPRLGQAIESRAETKIQRGQESAAFTEKVHMTLLGLICGALSLEWLLRRLMRLA